MPLSFRNYAGQLTACGSEESSREEVRIAMPDHQKEEYR